MAEIKTKVAELYELRALLLGYVVKETKADGTSNETILYPGFVNEKGITEGTKRIANKIGKKVNEEIEAVEKQRKEIREFEYNKELSKGEIPLTEKEIQEGKDKKDSELLNDEITITLEELLDFSKIENLSLSINYSTLYDKIFKN